MAPGDIGMTLASDLIADTKRHLLSGTRESMNKLDGAINSSVTDVTFEFTSNLPTIGSYVEVDLEIMYVWSMAGQVATVERGQLGSTAAAHSDDAVATINPRYPKFAILKAINDELRDLSSPMNGLFAVRSVELTASASSGSYDLTASTDVLEVLSVRHSLPGFTDSWVPLTNYELAQSAGGDFASGTSLVVHDGIVPGRTVRVLYKASFDALSAVTDNVETITGLPESMHDIPPLGAAMRLVAPREIRRNQTGSQGDTRRAEEVPAGAVTSSMRGIAALRQARINAEAAKLATRYPDRGFMPVGPSVW